MIKDKKAKISSPYCETMKRVVNYDENGNEFVTFEKEDTLAYQQSLGLVTDWSLDALLRAGVNPNFPIHTGYATRLDGLDALNGAVDAVNSALDEIENNEPKNE